MADGVASTPVLHELGQEECLSETADLTCCYTLVSDCLVCWTPSGSQYDMKPNLMNRIRKAGFYPKHLLND